MRNIKQMKRHVWLLFIFLSYYSYPSAGYCENTPSVYIEYSGALFTEKNDPVNTKQRILFHIVDSLGKKKWETSKILDVKNGIFFTILGEKNLIISQYFDGNHYISHSAPNQVPGYPLCRKKCSNPFYPEINGFLMDKHNIPVNQTFKALFKIFDKNMKTQWEGPRFIHADNGHFQRKIGLKNSINCELFNGSYFFEINCKQEKQNEIEIQFAQNLLNGFEIQIKGKTLWSDQLNDYLPQLFNTKTSLDKDANLNTAVNNRISTVNSQKKSLTSVEQVLYRFHRVWPVLKQPWYFNNPAGIACDNKGYVYISDTGNKRIQKFTKDGIFVTKWGKEGGGDYEFENPQGIVVDSKGYIYVHDACDRDNCSHAIKKYSSNGSFIHKWDINRSIGHIEIDIRDNIYILEPSSFYFNDSESATIKQYSPHGILLNYWEYDINKGINNWGFENFTLFRENDDIIFYLILKYNYPISYNRIELIQLHAKDHVLVKSNISFENVVNPLQIKVDEHGIIFTKSNSSICKILPYGFMLQKDFIKFSSDSVTAFSDFSIDFAGNIYISDPVQKFSKSGVNVSVWGSNGSERGYFNKPTDISVNYRSNNISVLDTDNNRVQFFSPNGEYINEWSWSNIEKENSFSCMEIDQGGNYYLAGWFLARLTKDGSYSRLSFIDFDGFDAIKSMRVIGKDNIYILINSRINYSAKILRYAPVNNSKFEKQDTIELDYRPDDFVIDNNNNFFISENTIIHKYDSDFQVISSWEEKIQQQIKLTNITKMSIDLDNNLYVVDNHTKVYKINPHGTFIANFGKYGFGAGDFGEIGDLCVLDGKVFLTDTLNNRVQSYRKVPRNQDLSKAIIVAGKISDNDTLWPSTQMCANYAYRTLRYQGFMKDEIFYLTSDHNLDLDSDGVSDVFGVPTKINLQQLINDEASDADTLLMYFSDHGGVNENNEGTFRLKPDDVITANELYEMLKDYSGKIIFINDSCHSGRFLPLLSKQNRIIITSAKADEEAWYINEGTISFSAFFWNNVFNGLSIKESFDYAAELMGGDLEEEQLFSIKKQHPLLDDNGDNVSNQSDGDIAQNTYIGNALKFDETPPIIHNTSEFPVPIETYNVLLYAEATDDDGIESVWAIIRPQAPRPNPEQSIIQDLPFVELHYYPNKQRYENYYSFNQKGLYYISIYARDRKQNTSKPVNIPISVQSNLSHKGIIIIGDTDDNNKRRSFLNNASLAYHALNFRGFSRNNIRLFSSNSLEGIPINPQLISKEIIKSVILDWGGTATMDLVLFITGESGKNGIALKQNTDLLKPSDIEEWLNGITTEGKIYAIYDLNNSGIFVPSSDLEQFNNKIIISSTNSEKTAILAKNGLISFAGFFWKRIFNGYSVNNAFEYSNQALFRFQKKNFQKPISYPNLLSTSKQFKIGIGNAFSPDFPSILSISPPQILNGETTATIVADKVTSANTIKSVEAFIIPPQNFKFVNSTNENYFIIQLIRDEATGQYRATYDDFTCAGEYMISVFALDNHGNMSIPLTTTVLQQIGADNYENDDSLSLATVIDIKSSDKSSESYIPQLHNFHNSNDEDWVMFFASVNEEYIIKATPQNITQCVPLITVINSKGYSETSLKEYQNSFDSDGIYYVRLSNEKQLNHSEGTNYTLQVSLLDAPDFDGGGIKGNIFDKDTHKPISKAKIYIDTGSRTALSSPERKPHFRIFGGKTGTHVLTVTAAGYIPYTEEVEILKYPETTHTEILLKTTDAPEMNELYINKMGEGYVSSIPYAIDCGKYCSEKFDINEPNITLTLSAIPVDGWEFVEWRGECSGNDQCIVTMEKDQTISAIFKSERYAVPSPPPQESEKKCFIQSLY